MSSNAIPEITDPFVEPWIHPESTDTFAKNWTQPERSEILLDNTHALMTSRTFESLHEYSASVPSGIHAGKMWRRHDRCHDYDFLDQGGIPTWLLCWYGPPSKPEDSFSINHRIILLSDGVPA